MLESNPAFRAIFLEKYLTSDLEDLREKIDANEIQGHEDVGLRNEYLARVILKRYITKIAEKAELATTTFRTLEERKNADQQTSGPQHTDDDWA